MPTETKWEGPRIDGGAVSRSPTPSRVTITALVVLAILVPPLGAAIGILGTWRATQTHSGHARRWYSATAIAALGVVITWVGLLLAGGTVGAVDVYGVLGGLVALRAWLAVTRSWEPNRAHPRTA